MEKYDLDEENGRLLAMVRQQELEIRVLEKRYPGITRVEKDSRGVFILPDMAKEDINDLIRESEKDFA